MLVDSLFNATLVGVEWVLYLLVVLSVVSVAIIVERSVVFALNRRRDRAVAAKLRAALAAGEPERARTLMKRSRSFEGRVCAAGLKAAHLGVGAVEEEVAGARTTEKARMEKNLAFLATVGSNAPFIGLFGTVLGIIKAFHDLSLGNKEGAAAVMAGISEALVATAMGLMVAIPAVIAFNFFKRRAQAALEQADTLSRVLFAHLKAERAEGRAKSPPRAGAERPKRPRALPADEDHGAETAELSRSRELNVSLPIEAKQST